MWFSVLLLYFMVFKYVGEYVLMLVVGFKIGVDYSVSGCFCLILLWLMLMINWLLMVIVLFSVVGFVLIMIGVGGICVMMG